MGRYGRNWTVLGSAQLEALGETLHDFWPRWSELSAFSEYAHWDCVQCTLLWVRVLIKPDKFSVIERRDEEMNLGQGKGSYKLNMVPTIWITLSIADQGCLSRIRFFSIPDPHQRI